ncbi:MAG: DUF1822 family protein [Cyanobacteria bacterium P01_D01_bin.44]
MTINLTLAEPREWWLEIPTAVDNQCWQESLALATPYQFHSVYLNQLCLSVFLPWLRAEYDVEGQLWPSLSSPQAMWEMVSGVGVTLPTKRLVVIPTEDIDVDELVIPQEWLDIPAWSPDYYLAMQINRAERWIRIWGYATHQQVKQAGRYDAMDRTYCIDGTCLGRNLNAFWLTYQLCPAAVTQAAVSPLPALTAAAADRLIEQLGTMVSDRPSAIAQPRLSVPFEQWGALLSRPEWLNRLLAQRRTLFAPAPVETSVETSTDRAVHLGLWFQNLFEGGWQSVETFLGGDTRVLTPNFRTISALGGADVRRVKPLELATPSDPQEVILLMELNAEADERTGVRIQVHPIQEDRYVPSGLALVIYSDADQMLQAVQSRTQDDYIQLPYFRCRPGTRFKLQVSLGDNSFSENFLV